MTTLDDSGTGPKRTKLSSLQFMCTEVEKQQFDRNIHFEKPVKRGRLSFSRNSKYEYHASSEILKLIIFAFLRRRELRHYVLLR